MLYYNEVAESGAEVKILRRLGFGACRLSLAVPKGDNYEGLSYFNGKAIATSYPRVLRGFLEKNGIEASIREIRGSVEIAPAAGIADAIFDIVSSGGTLVSNGLKEVERVLESEAVLIAGPSLSGDKMPIVDIFKAAAPYLLCNIIVLVLISTVPAFTTWLPALLGYSF